MPWHGRDGYKGETVCIPEGWSPTVENINALPLPLRHFIHALQTECDPAGTIRENVLVKEENYALHKMIEELRAKPSTAVE